MERHDVVWKTPALVRTFLEEVRGGVPLAAEQIDVMLRVIAGAGMPVRSFVDLGCGDGILSRALLAQYPEASGTLVDFSEPMLIAAQRQLGSQYRQLRFVRADFANPEWTACFAAQASFDVIVSGYAIHHQPDEHKRRLYGEIFGLLNPGGLFVNVEHVASRSPWIEALSDDLFVDSIWAFQRAQGKGTSRDRVADEFVHRPDKAANILAPVETQCEWLRACGFQDVDCYFKIFELAVFGGRRPGTCT